MTRVTLFAFLLSVGLAGAVRGQTPPASQDAASVWKTLSSPAMDPAKSAKVENIELVRDRLHIILGDGTIQFTQPANGVVFGAIFRGNGRLKADPPNPIEAQQLRLFTKQEKLEMAFSEATFSFTDNTLEELAKQVKWSPSGAVADELYAKRQQQREDLGAAHLPRLFKSLMSGDRARTGFFVADLKTNEKGWVEIIVDAMEPEEISVGRYADWGPLKGFDTWMSFSAGPRTSAEAFAEPAAKRDFIVRSYKIDAAVSGGAELSATTRVNLESRVPGERVLLFGLDSNLRVDSVKDSQGRALSYYQARERKDRLQSYGDYIAVVLPEPTGSAQATTLDFHYSGKHVVRNVGGGNYFCESFGWYPTMIGGRRGVAAAAFRADFELNFRSPKRYSLVATGHKLSESTDGDALLTSWKSDIPLAFAGFAFGDYKLYTDKVGDIDVQVYANREPDDQMKSIQGRLVAVGQLTPSAMAKTIGIETANTLKVFQLYFGPYPYKQIAVTNIPYSYGQGWPGLLYLSALTFLDSTQRHALGIQDQLRLTDFFRAHESSHQWWGQRVGWKSYHDQWLSEGFAEFSGYLYMQFRENLKEYFNRLRKGKELLRVKDVKGHTIESLGPIWMGYRIASSETGPGSYQDLIYTKGGYVLHMLRMMMYDFRDPNPDHNFQEMMKDFCQTFDNKPASTEDFKAIVEKHMTRSMDLQGNHRMDWFFNQYVYSTGIPQYEFHYTSEAAPDGKLKFMGTLTRTGVPDGWRDVVPLYAHRGQGLTRLGFIAAVQPETRFDFALPFRPDKLTINDYEDLLADVKH